MDELFGVADFSGIKDVGLAAESAKRDAETAAHIEIDN
jgi:hypothetical protein